MIFLILLFPCSLVFSREGLNYQMFCEYHEKHYETTFAYKKYSYEVMLAAKAEFPLASDIDRRKLCLDSRLEELKENLYMLYLKDLMEREEINK